MAETRTRDEHSRWMEGTKRLRQVLRLLSRRQRGEMLLITVGRIAMGMCDLLLAYAMYLLFFLLQNGHALAQRRWLPQTILSTAIATLGLVAARFLADLLSLRAMILYTQNLYADLAGRLVAGYHAMRWNEFTQRNRSELLKHATTTALDASFSYQLLIELVSSLAVMFGLGASLIYKSPGIACGLGIMVALLYGLHRFVIQERMHQASAGREQASRGLQAVLVEIFSSAKELRTYRNERFFHGRAAAQVKRLGANNVKMALLPQFSRLIAEQGVVALFLCVVILATLRHGEEKNLLSLLVFYFIVSRRLIPLISQIGMTLGMAEGAYENVQIIAKELEDCARNRDEPIVDHAPDYGWALQLEDISFEFAPDQALLHQVTLSIRHSETVIVYGRSGAGKSTLLNLVAGISKPAAGTVRIDSASVAYVPQEIALLDDTVRNNLLFGLQNQPDDKLLEALRMSNLEQFVLQLPLGLETRVGDNGILFSGGQRQRLGLARALLRGAKLLLLDEATSALDEESEQEILGRITKSGGPAVLLVTHREQARQSADRVYRLENGKLLEQAVAALAVEALS